MFWFVFNYGLLTVIVVHVIYDGLIYTIVAMNPGSLFNFLTRQRTVNSMEILIKVVAAGGIMGLLDFVWLGFIAKKLYYGEMGKLLLDKPHMLPALIFYAIYVVGVLVFVVNPALQKSSWLYALGMGALFGLVAYGTYDLTNLATMKDFSVKVVLVDLLWGMAITAATAVGTYFAVKSLM